MSKLQASFCQRTIEAECSPHLRARPAVPRAADEVAAEAEEEYAAEPAPVASAVEAAALVAAWAFAVWLAVENLALKGTL